jgi:hypothetical protein
MFNTGMNYGDECEEDEVPFPLRADGRKRHTRMVELKNWRNSTKIVVQAREVRGGC